MNIILFLIPLSAVLVILGALAFFWAVDHDQFDDLDTPALMPLTGDPESRTPSPRSGTEERADDAGRDRSR